MADYSALFRLAPYSVEAPRVDLYRPLAGIADQITSNRESARDQANRDRAFAEAQSARGSANARADREFAFRQAEAERAQRNADRAYGLQESQANRDPEAIRTIRALGLDPASPEARSLAFPKAADTIPAQVAERRAAVQSQGIDPNDPKIQSFILSGRMPREDQQPLSATDKKAIMEADEGIMSAETAIVNLRKAKELSRGAYSGPFAGQRGYVGSLMGAPGSDETTNLTNLVMTNALSQLKSIFGAAPTEGERKILLDLQGSVSQPDSVRQAIYDRAIALANRRLEFNRQRSNEMRGGSYYRPGGGASPTTAQPTPDANAPSIPPPPAAVEALRANPRRAEEFDAKYGVGSSARVLGVLSQ